MMLAFITYGCKGMFQTTYVMYHFRGGVVHWWNTLGKTISPNEPLQLTWVEFLVYFKHKFWLAQNMLELETKFLTLKKGNMFVDEYTNSFKDKMEFSLHLVPNKIIIVDMYEKGVPWEYYVLVH